MSGEWGNPHVVGYCRDCGISHKRGEAIEVFRERVRLRFDMDEDYRTRVEKLRGKKLVCFCAPEPCHGSVYLELLGEELSTCLI